jgi:hypothetical protein
MHRWYHADGPVSPDEAASMILALLERGYLIAHTPSS